MSIVDQLKKFRLQPWTALRWSQYNGLTAEQAWLNIESLLSSVKRYNRCIVLLFHNAFLDMLEHKDYMSIYKQCLEWVMRNNGVGLSTKHIYTLFNLYSSK